MAYLSGFRPYAVCTVGSDILRTRGLNQKMVKLALSSASVVFANGCHLAKKTQELSPSANVIPLLLGVNPTHYKLGNPPATPIHVFSNRWFLPVYNNEALIRGLAEIPQPSFDFEVVFASMGPLLEESRALANSILPSGIREKVHFLDGISDEQMRERLENSHVYVSQSRSDGTSTALLEALLSGLFPVLSDIPQNREWIDPQRKNGLLVPLDNPEALGKALYQAMTDPELRRNAVEYNRNLVLERATNSKNIERMASALEKLGKDKTRPSPRLSSQQEFTV